MNITVGNATGLNDKTSDSELLKLLFPVPNQRGRQTENEIYVNIISVNLLKARLERFWTRPAEGVLTGFLHELIGGHFHLDKDFERQNILLYGGRKDVGVHA